MAAFPTNATNTKAQELIRTLWRFERCGQFEKGLREVSVDWAAPDFLPDSRGLPLQLRAELHLRFASLLGYQGHYRKIPGSQLRARDILTAVLGDLESQGNEEMAAECENHIALTYSRTGEYAESRTWLAAAKARLLPETNIHRLASVMYEMLINVSEERYAENVEIYHRYGSVFRTWADDWIGASFYINAGIGLVETGRLEEALRCYEEGRYRSGRSSIWMYLGSIENERALVFKSLGRFEEAHAAVDRGIDVFRLIGDMSREGLLWDTKAGIYLDAKRFDEALVTIESAVSLLKNGENKGFLAEALVTEARILARIGHLRAALSVLTEAVQMAKTYSGNELAKVLIARFETSLQERNESEKGKRSLSELESGDLALEIPPSLAAFTRYQGIWINNGHLEQIGIKKGSLTIAVEAPIARGDLVALSEIASGEISCGFYDSDFGLVCLEGCGSEPQLFDLDSVKVIGKIVGIVGEAGADGRRIVRPVEGRRSFPEV